MFFFIKTSPQTIVSYTNVVNSYMTHGINLFLLKTIINKYIPWFYWKRQTFPLSVVYHDNQLNSFFCKTFNKGNKIIKQLFIT